MIATDPETITTIQRVGFTFREPGLFHRALGFAETVEGSRVVAVLGKTSAAHAAARPLIAIANVKTSNQEATPSRSGNWQR